MVDEEVGEARQKLSQAAEKGGKGLDNAADKAKEVLGPDDGN